MQEKHRSRLMDAETLLENHLGIGEIVSPAGKRGDALSALEAIQEVLRETEKPQLPIGFEQEVIRTIRRVIIHCSATRPDSDISAADIRDWHTSKGWSDIGYHWVIRQDGTIEVGRPMNRQGAHVAGHNRDSIGVCLVGGLDMQGKATASWYTARQWVALKDLVQLLLDRFELTPAAVSGHREYTWRDLDGDGEMEASEFLKECPCFDAAAWAQGELA